MATAPTPESVEETKRQIRTLVNEISEMSKSEATASDYYPAVLQRVVSALAAVGGAIWEVDTDGQVRLNCQIQLDPALIDSNSETAQAHVRLLGHVAQRGESELVPPNSSFGDNGEIANPTSFLLVLAPLMANKATAGVIEIFQRPDSPPDTQRGYLRFLDHMAKLIGDWLKGQSLQQVSDRQILWQQSDQFARLVHDNLDLKDTAYTIANEGRRLIECDRVSVATMRGNQAKVISISGQDSIESRSNIVMALNLLATRVVRSGEPLWYDGQTQDLPPQIEMAVEDYVDLSHGRTVTVLPLHRPEDLLEGDVKAKEKIQSETNIRREVIGALIIEQIETQIPTQMLQGRVDLVYEHSCRALANTLSHNQLFLMPLWKLLGRGMWLFRGSALPKTTAVLTLIAVGFIALFFVQIDFDLEGNGSLEPREQRQVYSPTSGEVEEIFVEHRSAVKIGDPLVKLRNRDLELQEEQTYGQLQIALSNARKNNDRIQRSLTTVEQRNQLSSDLQEYEQQARNYQSELALIRSKKQELLRTSPIDGVVTTWELEKNLQARPVTEGQVLLNIANTDSQWVIEVELPEKRMAYLDENLKGKEFLPVEFILMTEPSTSLTGKLYPADVHQRAEVSGEDGTIVRVRVIPDNLVQKPYPGARVIADIKCGKRSAAFVWFYQVVEWVRANVLF
jgi:multidrug efflux pump subunit AcrA (membrane-fusion protein)